jgi:hypothetical protein
MEMTALVIAVVAVALSALSLGWQAATFFLSGPRVRSVYTADGLAALERMGYTQHVLVIEAVNVGRLPASVNNWSLRFGNGVIYQNPRDPHNYPLPYRLESHTSAAWTAPVEDLVTLRETFVDESDEAATVRSEVDLQSRQPS